MTGQKTVGRVCDEGDRHVDRCTRSLVVLVSWPTELWTPLLALGEGPSSVLGAVSANSLAEGPLVVQSAIWWMKNRWGCRGSGAVIPKL